VTIIHDFYVLCTIIIYWIDRLCFKITCFFHSHMKSFSKLPFSANLNRHVFVVEVISSGLIRFQKCNMFRLFSSWKWRALQAASSEEFERIQKQIDK
jgi:hypothetical protein